MALSSASPTAMPAAAAPAAPFEAMRRHWPDYLKEAFGLFAFMVGAGAFTTLFMHPGSPVHGVIPSELARHVALGLVMGCVTAAIIYSPWGQRTGAHINPAVTWSFYRLGRIGRWDAVFYTLFQFLGALVAPVLLLLAIGEPFTHEKVKFATTQPGPAGALAAFAAEFSISFLLMLALLVAINSKRWEKKAGAIAAGLIALYIALESPLSGMSLNPARSFGSAVTAGQWTGMWLYFAAPLASMLLAAEAYLWLRRHGWIVSAEAVGGPDGFRLVRDHKEGPRYPVDEPKEG